MKNYRRRSARPVDADLASLESFLQKGLLPVSPRPEFVSHLQKRLSQPPPPTEENWLTYLFWAIAALITGILALVIGWRAAVALLTALGLYHQVKNQSRRISFTPFHPI